MVPITDSSSTRHSSSDQQSSQQLNGITQRGRGTGRGRGRRNVNRNRGRGNSGPVGRLPVNFAVLPSATPTEASTSLVTPQNICSVQPTVAKLQHSDINTNHQIQPVVNQSQSAENRGNSGRARPGRGSGRGRGNCGGSRGGGQTGNPQNRGSRGGRVQRQPSQLSFAGSTGKSPSPILPVLNANQHRPLDKSTISENSRQSTMSEDSRQSTMSEDSRQSTMLEDSRQSTSTSNSSDSNSNSYIKSPNHREQRSSTPLNNFEFSPTKAGITANSRNSNKVCPYSIPRSTFQRVVRELTNYIVNDGNTRFGISYRYTPGALDALHEVTEDYLTKMFMVTGAIATHSGRTTITYSDMVFARKMEAFLGKSPLHSSVFTSYSNSQPPAPIQ